MVVDASKGDTVWFIRDNTIYKGVIDEDLGFDYCHYYRVETVKGLLVFAEYHLYHTKESLVQNITHESCSMLE